MLFHQTDFTNTWLFFELVFARPISVILAKPALKSLHHFWCCCGCDRYISFITTASWATSATPSTKVSDSQFLAFSLRFCHTLLSIFSVRFLSAGRLCVYSASALLAMQTAVIARGYVCPSVRPSVCSSVRQITVFCPDKWRYDRAIFSIR